MSSIIEMKEDETFFYNGRNIYLNKWGEYCVCHLWGGMVAYNSSFNTIEKAMLYIDKIVRRRDMKKEDFQLLAVQIKNIKEI